MIFSALIPMLGLPILLVSGRRIFAERPFTREISVAIVVLGAVLSRNSLLTWCLIGALALILRGASRFFHRHAEIALLEALPSFLDRAILSMKAGRPLKTALRESARELSPSLARRWHEISDRLEFSGSDDGLSPTEREFLRALRSAGGAKVIDRLEAWRHSARLREEFRRKSGQITLQARAQAALAAFLFVPVFFWNVFGVERPSFRRCALAVSLFALAQVWIHVASRRWKWTV